MAQITGSTNDNQPAVIGQNTGSGDNSAAGVLGESAEREGVVGTTKSPTHAGIAGISDNPAGAGAGVYGEARNKGAGVAGIAKGSGVGVYGESKAVEGVVGRTNSPTHAAIAGITQNPDGTGAGLFGESHGKGPAIFGKGPFAALFDGDIVVHGSISVKGDVTLTNADCAELFDVDPAAESTEAGMVLTLEGEGRVRPCTVAYDSHVAGVISGAGMYRPALILNKETGKTSGVPVALVGRVCCLVDASYAPVQAGDLLTTSETPGHAMKASDRSRALGAIVGKALAPLSGGRGLIPVLVAMQ
jgi:hypothetical protein